MPFVGENSSVMCRPSLVIIACSHWLLITMLAMSGDAHVAGDGGAVQMRILQCTSRRTRYDLILSKLFSDCLPVSGGQLCQWGWWRCEHSWATFLVTFLRIPISCSFEPWSAGNSHTGARTAACTFRNCAFLKCPLGAEGFRSTGRLCEHRRLIDSSETSQQGRGAPRQYWWRQGSSSE